MLTTSLLAGIRHECTHNPCVSHGGTGHNPEPPSSKSLWFIPKMCTVLRNIFIIGLRKLQKSHKQSPEGFTTHKGPNLEDKMKCDFI